MEKDFNYMPPFNDYGMPPPQGRNRYKRSVQRSYV